MTTPRNALERPKLAISFSGGRTSAYMTQRLLREYSATLDVVVTFANTGLEHEKTLEFVNNCDKHMGFKTVWLEAVVNPTKGQGIRHKTVTFETAARDGEPFEEVIKKDGIQNSAHPGCSRSLKSYCIKSYFRSLPGWGTTRNYQTAIGIRADEVDRMVEKAKRSNFIYPLVKWNVNKKQVLLFWEKQSFDLDIQEHYGNCVTCWKKSDRKLLTIARENPNAFNFMDRMEKTYPCNGPGGEKSVFFRNHRSTQDILALAKKPFRPFIPGAFQMEMFDPELDTQSACGETCEIGADQ